ncbi:flagellar hook-length control protein FliK [Parapedomonas caeni]
MSLNTTSSAISPALGGTPGTARPTAGGTGSAGGFEALLASLAAGDTAAAGTGGGASPAETVAGTGDVAWPTTLLGVDARNQPIIINSAPEAAPTTAAASPADAATGSVDATTTAPASPDVAPASVSTAKDPASQATEPPATASVVTTANAGIAAAPPAEPAPAGKAGKPAPDHGAPATAAETRTRTTDAMVSTAPAEIAATPARDDTTKAVEVAMADKASAKETLSDGDDTSADTAALAAQVPTPTPPPEPKASPVIAFALPPAIETPVQAEPNNTDIAIDTSPRQTPAIGGDAALTAGDAATGTSDVAAPPAEPGKAPPPALKDYAAARDATDDDAASSASAPTMTGSTTTDASAGGRSSLESLASGLEQTAGQNRGRETTAVGTDSGTGNAAVSPPGAAATGAEAARAAQASTQASTTPEHAVRVHNDSSLSDSVGVAISRHAAAGKTEFTLRLDPAELGRIEVKLHVSENGKVEATVSADNASTYDLLRRDASTLERALTDAGLKTDSGSLSFNLRQQDGQPNQQQSGSRQTAAASDWTGQNAGEPQVAATPAPAPRSATGLLDVFA